MSYETAIKDIEFYASELRIGNANEAMTRFHLIDEIVGRLLGWSKADISIEKHIKEGGEDDYIDYILSTGRHSILIETKRVGGDFSGLPKSRKSSLKGTWTKRPIGKAINQARDYGRKIGVGFCVATNGFSWVIFPINRRDQVTFEDSLCIIFQDLNDLLADDAGEIRALLSRQAVVGGALDRALLGTERDQNEPRRLNHIYDRSFSKINRTSIFPHIEREIITSFSEELLSENDDILEKCYVQTPERVRFDSRLKMYITPREQILKTRPIRPISGRGAGPIEKLLKDTTISTRPIALLTLELVGAGKTTFLNYASKISSKDTFKITDSPLAYWVYADFRDFSETQDARKFLINTLFEYIKNHPHLNDYQKFVRHAYASDIKALLSGPLAAMASDESYVRVQTSDLLLEDWRRQEPYALKIAAHAVKSKPLFIVVDNVDQIENPEAQAKIFSEATALARSLKANLVLAMRDSTYVKNRGRAVFDAFDFDAVYIDSPEISAVLSKRFTLAEQLLKEKRIEFHSESGSRIIVEDARKIIQLLSQSVLGTEVGRIIEVAATGDTRLALQMTRQFLQFGYTSTSRALEIYQRTGKYFLPVHEAIRAIMLGNQGVYRENFSVFGNPFDARLGRTDMQMLRLFVMSALVSYSSDRDFEGLPAREILSSLEQIGVSEQSAEQIISDLQRFRYVFSRSHQSYSKESIIIPSRLCGYVVRELISRLVFIETTMFDTFISHEETWDSIKENMKIVYRTKDPIRKLHVRKEIVTLFYDLSEWLLDKNVQEARNRKLPPQWCSNILTKARPDFLADLSRAITSAQRTAGTNGQSSAAGGPGIDNLPLFQPLDRARDGG